MDNAEQPVSIVTGASGGIGSWIALGLARAGHRVVMVCRDPARGAAAAEWIGRQAPAADTTLRLADLRSLRAVHELGQSLAADYPRLAVLVNNAGMFTSRQETTAEGREAVLAVNHLAPWILTETLEAALRAGAPSRIVNVGSSTSDRAGIDPADLELTRNWGMVRAYGASKLAMMMSSFARAERLRGSGVVVNVVHPGLVATGLIRERGPIGIAWRLLAAFARTEEQGAETPLHVALAPDWATVTGVYAKNRAVVRPNPRALDPTLIAQVERATRNLVSETLGPGAAESRRDA